jgi:hypothetical protein
MIPFKSGVVLSVVVIVFNWLPPIIVDEEAV